MKKLLIVLSILLTGCAKEYSGVVLEKMHYGTERTVQLYDTVEQETVTVRVNRETFNKVKEGDYIQLK